MAVVEELLELGNLGVPQSHHPSELALPYTLMH